MARPSRVAQLRAQGFDRSYAIPFESAWKVLCSACEALVINSVPCHELRCPNEARARREAAEQEEAAE